MIQNPLKIFYKGHLKETGWVRSFFVGKPVNKEGAPLPWLTLPFIQYFMRLDNTKKVFKNSSMFEYGSGQSTLFFSKYFKKIVSVEYNRKWFDYIEKKIPRNVELIFKKFDKNGEYARSVSLTPRKYDLILVDGRDRVNCLKNSYGMLSRKGVLVLDNSNRKEYKEGVRFLMQNGFKRLDFWGMSLGLKDTSCTTIFYKEENIFKI